MASDANDHGAAGPSEQTAACAEAIEEAVDDTDSDMDDESASLQRIMSRERRAKRLEKSRIQMMLDPFPFAPLIRPMGISDLHATIALENAAFVDPQHRASAEKIEYRLTTCPELSMGLFQTIVPDLNRDVGMFPALEFANPVETNRPNNAKSVLLAHIISTASDSNVVNDREMRVPADWKASKGKGEVGHVEGGKTICMHSLVVSPKLQGCGLGKLIIKAFVQQMRAIGSERVALICQSHLVSYYEGVGFKHAGASNAEFGGGGWHNMVYDSTVKSRSGTASSASSF